MERSFKMSVKEDAFTIIYKTITLKDLTFNAFHIFQVNTYFDLSHTYAIVVIYTF